MACYKDSKAGHLVDEDKRQFLDRVTLQTKLFVEGIYDLAEQEGQDNAWTLTCLLHSSAYLGTLVAVTATNNYSDGSASEMCETVLEFIKQELYENVKLEVMN